MRLRLFGLFGLAILITSCALTRVYLPKRSLHVILYTDGSCLYSFEGMDYGNRADQKWEFIGSSGPDLIICENEKLRSNENRNNLAYAENWPRVSIELTRQRKINPPRLSPEGHFIFQPESDKRRRKYRKVRSIAATNGSAWSVLVALESGSDANWKTIAVHPGEYYAPCGTEFESTDNPRNSGLRYSKAHQDSTGIYMEINTEVRAESGAC